MIETIEDNNKWFIPANTLFYPDDGILVFEISTISTREKWIRERIQEMSEENEL